MDKLKHLAAGFAVGIIFAFLMRIGAHFVGADYLTTKTVMGVSAGVAATFFGVWKEIEDYQDYGQYSVADMLFTIAGGIAVMLICLFAL